MERRPLRAGREAGFSLIEALVVLAVAGMALMLIFAAAARSSQDGFRLGQKALGAADAEIAADAFRSVVSSLRIEPVPADQQSAETGGFAGDSARFDGPAVLTRTTVCGPAGPVQRIRLELRRTGGRDTLVCETGGATAELIAFDGPAAFAYSVDGAAWTDRWTDQGEFAPRRAGPRRSQVLFVRLAAADGTIEIIGATPRERPPAEPAIAAGPAL